MTTKNEILTYLKEQPLFRERTNRYKGIANLLVRKYPGLKAFNRETVIDILTDSATMNRWCNKLQKDKPELRGSDYDDKYTFEAQAKKLLGYHVED